MIAVDVGQHHNHRTSRPAAAHEQEVLMGQAVPSQHPAVVLRSHFNQLRALLAVALIALMGLTVAVVILASEENQLSDATSASPTFPHQEHPLRSRIGSPRYDGGPEEGTRGIVPVQSPTTRYDGGPEEGTRGGGKDYSKNAATGDTGGDASGASLNGPGARTD
jgi:hypothetical protein